MMQPRRSRSPAGSCGPSTHDTCESPAPGTPRTLVQVYELEGPDLKTVKEVEKKHAFKCGTFGASSLAERRLATGNFGGELQIWDLENTSAPLFSAQAHASIVNAIDGCGGQVGC
jgi:hypothetical protein